MPVFDDVLTAIVGSIAANVGTPDQVAWLWWCGDVEASLLASNPEAVLHLDTEQASAVRQAVVEKVLGRAARTAYKPLVGAECLCRAVADAISGGLPSLLSNVDVLTPMLRAFFEEGVEPRLHIAAAHSPLVVKYLVRGVRAACASGAALSLPMAAFANMMTVLWRYERLRHVSLLQVVLANLMEFQDCGAPVAAWLQTAVAAATEEERMTFVERALAAHDPALLAAVESAMAPLEFERALETAVVAFATGPYGAHPVSLYELGNALSRLGPCVGAVTPEQVVGALPFVLCAAYDWLGDDYDAVRDTFAMLTTRVIAQLIRRGDTAAAALFDAAHVLAMLARTEVAVGYTGVDADSDPFVKVLEGVIHSRRENRERMDFIGLLIGTENTRGRATGVAAAARARLECDEDADSVVAHDLVDLLNDPRMVEGARADPVHAQRLMCVPAGYTARFLGFAHFDAETIKREVCFLTSLADTNAREFAAVDVVAAAEAAGVDCSDAALLVAAAYHGPDAPICDALRGLPQFLSPSAQALVGSPHFRHTV
jgi:hypothetical protein